MKFNLVTIFLLLILSPGKASANNLSEFQKYSLNWGNSDYEIYSLLGKASEYQLTPFKSDYKEEGWKVFWITIEYPDISFRLVKTPQKQFIQYVKLKGCGEGQSWAKITCNGVGELTNFLGDEYTFDGSQLVYTLPSDISDMPIKFDIKDEKVVGITWTHAMN